MAAAEVQMLDFGGAASEAVVEPKVGRKAVGNKRRRDRDKRMAKEQKQRDTQAKKELKQAMKKYDRGEGIKPKSIKNLKHRRRVKIEEDQTAAAVEAAARAEILLPSSGGYLEPENELEETWRFSQEALKPHLDEQSSNKSFDLRLPDLGPYNVAYTRNGKYMALAGRKGHIALMEWGSFKLNTEFHVRETIRDVTFLHDQSMLAVAQKKHTFIYDNTGVEIHCLRKHFDVNCLQFLPFHFLLATVGKTGYLKYIDTSTGTQVVELRTKLGECKAMAQNPRNAVLHLGHNNGTVTLWSPNLQTSLVKMLCHRAPILDVAVDNAGKHMVTSGLDGQVKVWDLRTYKVLHSYFTPTPASTISISQSGMIALGSGPHVTVWKDAITSKQRSPYLKQDFGGRPARKVSFCPYEDVLGVGHSAGFSSMIVPGSGEANFDSFQDNPFQTRKQTREALVHKLLDKLQPSMINLDTQLYGLMDPATRQQMLADHKERKEIEAMTPLDMSTNKKRGRSRSSKRFRRKRKNIIDKQFSDRAEKIKNKETLRQKDRDRKQKVRLGLVQRGAPKSALDRFEK